MHPKHLTIKDFTYDLPDEKIAKYPLEQRDSSKLLIWNNHSISEDIYYNIAGHLQEGSLLILNNTRVVEARLLFKKDTGGIIEIFVLEPHDEYNGIEHAMNAKGKARWKCLIGGASKWKHGLVLHKEIRDPEGTVHLQAQIKERLPDTFTIEFIWQPDSFSFAQLLHRLGTLPIPPYLKRETEISDSDRYQTIYARQDGSMAAPTAGLHFTERTFLSFAEKKIQTDFVTLHVGAGTFMPVKSESLEGHQMHSEFMNVKAALIQKVIDNTGHIFAVGTTSFRTLESLYWMGLKCFLWPDVSTEALEIKQWEAYDLEEQAIPVASALNSLLAWMKKKSLDSLINKTSLLVSPGYKTKIVKGLVTNFHQPGSTLLLLVAALIGEEWKRVYDYALKNNFRFLSYGDGCLLYIKNANSE